METQERQTSSRKSAGCFVRTWVVAAVAVGFLLLLVITGVVVHKASVQSAPGGVGGARVCNDASGKYDDGTSCSVTSELKTKAKVKDVRLPLSIEPLSYVVKLQPLINGNLSIMGYMEMTFNVIEPTSKISIHMADIVTYNDTIMLKSATGAETAPEIVKHSYDKDREFYVAELGGQLAKGSSYTLAMRFRGYLNDQLKGFYRSSYDDEQGNKVMLATTQFQPTDARRAFPCMDEPALKAKFKIFLARQTNMSALSNMPLMTTEPMAGQAGWVWDEFKETVPMSTYLLAFIVSDFASVQSPKEGESDVVFKIWARKGAINQANYSRDIGPKIQRWFETYFNIPFPLPKQDMVAIPDFSAGAMENWGLITYRETALLYDPEVSSVGYKSRVASVVSHELAHQWFGDLVTPSWWTDLWLNEGFASYLEDLGVDAVDDSFRMKEYALIRRVHHVFEPDSLESSHEIRIPIENPEEMRDTYTGITYDKGSSIIRMMNHFLGEATFKAGLSKYLNHFKYKSAEQDDLWRFLTTQAHMDGALPKDLTVKKIMDTWTLQMGYPVVDVNFNADGTADLKQERFLLVKNENSTDKHDYKWWIPISYTSQDRPNFEETKPAVWMDSASKRMTDMPPMSAWKVFNIQQTGYFRVNYDEKNWKMLVEQLKRNHKVVHLMNRANLIDDALDLARSGRLSYDIAMDVTSYLGKETEYVPWRTAINNLGYLQTMLIRTPAYGSFKKYMLKMLEPLYQSVGFTDSTSDDHLTQHKRRTALQKACDLEHPDCLLKASELYKTWMENPTNYTISPNLKLLVYCVGIKQGGETEWNFAWEQYLKANVASEKQSLLSALGCTNKIWLLSKYLGMSYKAGTGIRKQDAATAFYAVAGNDFGRDLAWNYLRNNWKHITDYYGSGLFALGRVISAGASKFSTKLKLKELEQFRKENAESLTTAKRAVQQSVERTNNNIQWIDNHYEVIVAWLNRNGY